MCPECPLLPPLQDLDGAAVRIPPRSKRECGRAWLAARNCGARPARCSRVRHSPRVSSGGASSSGCAAPLTCDACAPLALRPQEEQRRLQELLGTVNLALVRRAVQAMEQGDVQAVG